MKAHIFAKYLIISSVALMILGISSFAWAAQIKLAWDANTEPDLEGYRVYYGTASRTYGNSIDVGNVTTYTLTGLAQGQTYYISVTAHDVAQNESDYSNEVSGVAQEVTVAITVTTNPVGRQIIVDGASYTAPQTFNWVVGSSHSLSVTSPQNGTSGTRYVYSSWSDGGGQTHSITVPSSQTTYTANFTTQYSLVTSANPTAGGTVTPAGTNWYNSGQSVSVSATANTGYTFVNWSGDLSGTTNPASVTMSGPRTATANFTQNQYTLSVSVNPSGSGAVSKNPNKSTYVYGEQVTLTATANSGYTFSNWSGDVTGSVNPVTLTINGNKVVTANFAQNQYTLTVSVNPAGSGSVSKNPDKSSYAYGEQITLTATSNPGYIFANWSGDVTGTSNPTTLTMNGNKSVTANYSAVTETISTPNTPSGPASGVTGSSYTYSTGGASSNLGDPVQYRFNWGDGTYSSWSSSTSASKSWSSAGTYAVRAEARCSIHTDIVSSPSASLSVSISQGPVSCTVTTSPTGREFTVDGTNYTTTQTFSWTPGSTHTLGVSSPQSGPSGTRYVFSSWSDGGAETHTITVPTSPTTYTASFTTQYTLTTTVNALEAGTVNPSGTNWYNSGESVSILATPNPGYSFSGWSGDLSGSTNPANLAMNGPKSVVANFTPSSSGILAVTPPSGFTAVGNEGGPFVPSSYTYTLQNTGGSPIGWSASKSKNWVSLSGTGGTLAPGASTTVTLSLNGEASRLPAGYYTDLVTFNDNTSAQSKKVTSSGTTRPVELIVNPALVKHKITTDPPGLDVEVDGVVYRTPKTLKWAVGSIHRLSVASPQEGKKGKRYLFASWSDAGDQTHDVVAPSTPTTYTAYFTTQVSLTTSVNLVEGGTVTPCGTFWYDKGQVVTLTASANPEYTFKSWRNEAGQVVSRENPHTVTMNKPKNLQAHFKQNTYVLTLLASPRGTIQRNPKKPAYVYGEQVTLTAKANSGYLFQNWTGDLSGQESPITITISGNMTVGADYVIDDVTPRSKPKSPEAEPPLIGKLEGPSDRKSVSGVKPIYGWALDGEGISKVELFIDGTYVCDIPYGGLREDVKAQYPTYPKAAQSGFALIWNYTLLSAGEHTVLVRAHNLGGKSLDLTANVTVLKFHGEPVEGVAPDLFSPQGVSVTADGVTKTYDIYLQWLEELQDFGIAEIVPRE